MFKNKSDNLKILIKFKLKKSIVPNFIGFTLKITTVIEKIKKINNNLKSKICVRSAFALEDNKGYSLAGKFDSYININNKKFIIEKYVRKLILQYSKFDKKNLNKSKIFVQNYTMIQY